MKKNLCVFLACGLICLLSGAAYADLNDGLMAYYPFTGNANDGSGNGNDGTVNGAVLTGDRYGNPNSAYEFDGTDDYIDVPHSETLDINQAISISVWLRADEAGSSINLNQNLINRASIDSGQSYAFLIRNPDYPDDDFIELRLMQPNSYAIHTRSSPELLLKNMNSYEWYHFVSTWDGEMMKVYKNGTHISAADREHQGLIPSFVAPMAIGRRATDTRYFKGSLDEIRIYNRALSEEEIGELYCEPGLPENCSNGLDDDCDGLIDGEDEDCMDLNEGLVAYYPFNEDAIDGSGNGNDGTVHGAVLTADRYGNPDSAYEFDGTDDSITVPPSENFNLGTNVTFSAWVNMSGPPNGGGGLIFRKVRGGREDKQFGVTDDENAYFYLFNCFGGKALYSTGGSLPLHKWTHIAGTYDGSTARIYMNGVFDNSKSASGNVSDADATLHIGGNRDTDPQYQRWYKGTLDEIRMYNRVLSDAEIHALYCAPVMPENCYNGFDDDCDGLTDGEDEDCADMHAEYWANIYPGVGARSGEIKQTVDGGYIVANSAYGSGLGGHNLWIVKLDDTGKVTWQYVYGGSGYDFPNSIQQTTDGGFIVAGRTESFGAGVYDAWVIKLDRDGDVLWQKTHGGIYNDTASSIQQTQDGGYIMAGYIGHWSPDQHPDLWLLKLDPIGAVQWEKTYGGERNEHASSIKQTLDGGYIVAGHTATFGPDIYSDYWLLKIDSDGNVIWQKVMGASGHDVPYSIQQTTDGGFVVAGYSQALGAGGSDIWIIKLDINGDVIWQRAYGGTDGEFAYSIQEVSDGSLIVSGIIGHNGAGEKDALVLNLDGNGDILWQKTYIGSSGYWGTSIQETSDRGYILTAVDGSFMTYKLNENGEIPWCDREADSHAGITETYVVSENTNVVPEPFVSTVTETNISGLPTSAEQSTVCDFLCWDSDGDTYNDANCGGDDCDDTSPDVNPGATEIPWNGIDDDCNPDTPLPWEVASVVGAELRASSDVVNCLFLLIVPIGAVIFLRTLRRKHYK